MSDLENKENTEPSLNNIKINIDKLEGGGENSSNTYDKLSLDDLTEEPTLDKQPAEIEKLIEIKPKPKKVDRRKTTSRINIAKAREAKLRKQQEKQRQLKELFGDDSDSETSETESGESSEEDSDTQYSNKYHKYQYQRLAKRQAKEIDDLKNLVYKLAHKQKKRRNKKKKKKQSKSPQQTPNINIYTTKSEPIDIPQPSKPRSQQSIFNSFLKDKLINN